MMGRLTDVGLRDLNRSNMLIGYNFRCHYLLMGGAYCIAYYLVGGAYCVTDNLLGRT
jgi:hypothetical protein